ncbi:hypothetical protein [uncultured Porphyromonas sp.]|uniref:hypothetical protein n=1 Tax=uncultured Porphyromonas sp. TaxID=159274 RepID=UPI00262F6F04|nr:hypothetical protein [uncultured Porphyromonas sp.]
MKKIFMTLAAVGLFFSCSKENAEPQLQPSTQQEQEAALQVVDPNTPGAVRLSLDADVEPFAIGSGAFVGEDAKQGARATEAIVGGPDINSAISYHITPEGDGKVPVLLYLYGSEGVAKTNVRATVTKNGKAVRLTLGMLLDSKSEPMKSFAAKKMEGVKLAFIIGHDGDATFTNKGAQLITYKAGQKVTLGGNYIMLKATDIPLKYDAASKTIAPTKAVTLGMQGYLIGARFRNRFPEKMYKYLWDKLSSDPYATGPTGKEKYASPKFAQVIDRPPLDIMFRVDNLSATYQTKISYSTSSGEFSVGRDQELAGPNIIRQRVMSPGFKASAYDKNGRPFGGKTHGNDERENFLDATSAGVFYVPVGSAPSDTQFSEGEQFVIVYCPNPYDRGSIAYRSPKKLFYDGSPFSQMKGNWKDIGERIVFHGLANDKNSFVKLQNTPTSPSDSKRSIRSKSADNKFYFVTFTIESNRMDIGSSWWSSHRGVSYPLYDAALKQYKIKK